MSENTELNMNPTGDKRIADFIEKCKAQNIKGKILQTVVKTYAESLPNTRVRVERVSMEDSRISGAVACIGLTRFLNTAMAAEQPDGILHTICSLLKADGNAQHVTFTALNDKFASYIYHSDVNGGCMHGASHVDDKTQTTELFPESFVYIRQASGTNSFPSLYTKCSGLYHWFSPQALMSKDQNRIDKIESAVRKGSELLMKAFGVKIENKKP